jgi:hypothetical protein
LLVTCGSQSALEFLDAHEQSSLLAEHLEQQPAFAKQEDEYQHSHDSFDALGHGQCCEPSERTQLGCGRSKADDESGHASQQQIADEGGPAGGSRVQLAKAMAVGLPSLCQVIADTGNKEQQQSQGPQRSPPRRDGRQERQCHGQFRHRQQHA